MRTSSTTTEARGAFPAAAVAAETPLQVLTLGLGEEIFAIETGTVREVLDVIEMTSVPGSRRFVVGLVNVRGKVVPVVDMKHKFGMPATDTSSDTRIVVIETTLKGEASLVGILADHVNEVTELATASLEEPPRIGMTWRPEFIRAVGKRDAEFIIVMDIGRVFASEERACVKEAAPWPTTDNT